MAKATWMHSYQLTLNRRGDDGYLRVVVQAYTAQDAITVAEVSICPTGMQVDDGDAGLREIVRRVTEVRCLNDDAIYRLADWKRDELLTRGYANLDATERGD